MIELVYSVSKMKCTWRYMFEIWRKRSKVL